MKNPKCDATTAMTDIPGKWSNRALRLIGVLPEGSNILDFYWKYWVSCGKNKYRGFKFGPDHVGLSTYDEIRLRLVENGFPDLDDEMFVPSNFCPEDFPRPFFDEVVTKWDRTSTRKRAELRIKIARLKKPKSY